MAETKKVVIEIEIDKQNAGKRLAETEKELARLSKLRTELLKKAREGNELTQEETELLEEVTIGIQKQTKARNQTIKAIQNEENSINALRANIIRLTDERNNLNTATDEGRKRFDELTIALKEQNELLNEASQQAGSFKDNIGNYAKSVEEAIQQTSIFGVSVKDLQGVFNTIKLGILENVKALGLFKIALIGTGVGLLIVALGSLITFLTQTEKGTQKLNQIFAQLGKLIEPLISGFALLGEGIFTVIEAVIDFGVALSDTFGGTNANQAKAYAAQLQVIDKELQQLEADSSAILATEEKLKNIRDNESVSIEERIKANDELGKVELARVNAILSKEKDKLAILKAQFEGTAENLRTEEQRTAIAEQTKKVNELISDSLGRQNEQITNAVALSKERFENEQALRDAQLQNEILSGRVAENSNKALQENIKNIKLRAEEEVKALKATTFGREADANKIKTIEITAENEILQAKKDFFQQQKDAYADLIDKNKQKTLKNLQEQLDLINAEILYTKDGTAERLKLLEDASLKEADIRRVNGETALLIERETQQAIREQRQAFFGEIQSLQFGFNQVELANAKKLSDELLKLDAVTLNQRIAYDLALLQYKQATKQAEVDLEVQTATSIAQIAGALITIAGENTTAGKLLASVQASFETYSAITKTLNAFAGQPIPGYAIAQAVITGVFGLLQVAKINGLGIPDLSGSVSAINGAIGGLGTTSQNLSTTKANVPKFATGGLVNGIGSGTSDSIPAMLSNGESIINAKATEMFKPLLSAINVAGGGVPFVSHFASGGIATAQSIQSVNLSALSSDLANVLANMPAPVVSVIDINKATNRKKVKVGLNSL